MYDTYEDATLLAGELVAFTELHPTLDPGTRADLLLLAGTLRGLIMAGEPINSPLMRQHIRHAHYGLLIQRSFIERGDEAYVHP